MNGRPWTEPEIRRLRAYYPYINTCDLARVLGKPIWSVYHKANKLGIYKGPEFNRGHLTGNEGRDYRFKKGFTPWNKGRKGLHFPGSEKGQFKKGSRPQTWVPIGSERVRDEGYLYRKISDDQVPARRNWRAVHSMLWEARRGPVPRGHAVVFRNGNRADIRIENLELITRRELMARNTIHNLPPALKEVIAMKAALERTINRLERHEREHRPGSP